jgi:hypothetical protein
MSAVTDQDGTASVEAPLGKVDISVGNAHKEAWVAVDLETVVEVTLR